MTTAQNKSTIFLTLCPVPLKNCDKFKPWASLTYKNMAGISSVAIILTALRQVRPAFSSKVGPICVSYEKDLNICPLSTPFKRKELWFGMFISYVYFPKFNRFGQVCDPEIVPGSGLCYHLKTARKYVNLNFH